MWLEFRGKDRTNGSLFPPCFALKSEKWQLTIVSCHLPLLYLLAHYTQIVLEGPNHASAIQGGQTQCVRMTETGRGDLKGGDSRTMVRKKLLELERKNVWWISVCGVRRDMQKRKLKTGRGHKSPNLIVFRTTHEILSFCNVHSLALLEDEMHIEMPWKENLLTTVCIQESDLVMLSALSIRYRIPKVGSNAIYSTAF